ncbi:unnamed protein product [Haemonchus placei]|uniref:DEP domain-containing protein n=1 Tax=Haemonchus placei TaxID=6290 RepID=A0A0N4WBQ9_HAEPC|nr:unnamed protein product [Haemonchus placei]
MPVKRHRRQLTSFENSFTGKEAVDFLLILLPRLIFEGRQEFQTSFFITYLHSFSESNVFNDMLIILSSYLQFTKNPRFPAKCHDPSKSVTRAPVTSPIVPVTSQSGPMGLPPLRDTRHSNPFVQNFREDI